jgi:CheY-like chemotaxis protein
MDAPKTILIVDDDPQVLGLIDQTLTRAGYRTVTAGDPLVALERISAGTPDLMILDMHLPGLHGLELVQVLRDSSSRFTPAIAITGDHAVDPDEVQAHGFVALLHKPFTVQDLRRTVADSLS